MRKFITTTLSILVAAVGYAQTYLPITAGAGNPLSGELYINNQTNSILHLKNTAGSGKDWNFQSYLDGKLYVGITGVANYYTIDGVGNNTWTQTQAI